MLVILPSVFSLLWEIPTHADWTMFSRSDFSTIHPYFREKSSLGRPSAPEDRANYPPNISKAQLPAPKTKKVRAKSLCPLFFGRTRYRKLNVMVHSVFFRENVKGTKSIKKVRNSSKKSRALRAQIFYHDTLYLNPF